MVSRREFTTLTAAAAIGVAAAQSAGAQPNDAESTYDRIRRTKKLRIGAVAAGAPYYFKELATGQWRGFYFDICKQLAEDLEAEIDVIETVWGNAVLDLQSNKVDIFFGLTPTPKRSLAIDFSEQAFGSAVNLIGKKPLRTNNWTDLNTPDSRLSVDAGSVHDQVITNVCPKANVLRFKSVEEAAAALQAGRVDYQVSSILLSLSMLKKNPSLGEVIMPSPHYISQSSAGLRRERDPTFLKYISYWLRYYRNNGFIRQVVLTNMALVGLSESDWPKDLAL